jgi:hypothetical protein
MMSSPRTILLVVSSSLLSATVALVLWSYWNGAYAHGMERRTRCYRTRVVDQRGPFTFKSDPLANSPYEVPAPCAEHDWEPFGCWATNEGFLELW